MKKKKSLLSKKEKLIIVCIAVISFIIILGIVLTIGKSNEMNGNNETKTDVNQQINSIKYVVEYLESDFISLENSNANGYDLDIYVSFRYNLYEGDISKEIYFTNFYEKIAIASEFKSFRLIDTEKGITIEVRATSNGISEVKINGEINYFKKEDSRKSIEKQLSIENIELEINSEELKDLIANKWETKNAKLGSKESSFYKYDIYFDEGYEIRNIQGKVFNIVFTNKYKGQVVGGYKTGTDIERISEDLGKAYEESEAIGYKTKDFYVWFSQDEISIYPIYKTDYTEFENLVKEYEQKQDVNDFMYKITDIWKDYTYYESKQNYVEICYADKGVKFEYSVSNPIGVEIYANYRGDLKDELEEHSKVYYKLDKNLTGEIETKRLDSKCYYDDTDIEDDPIHYSRKFMLMLSINDEERYTNVKFQSLDDNYPNNEFDETIAIDSYVWADDYHFIYSVRGEGIYIYDARNMVTTQLLSGSDEYKITNFDRNTNIIEYDGIQAKIEI